MTVIRDYSDELITKNKRRRLKFYLTLFLLGVFLLAGGAAYAFFYTDYLMFKTVKITGLVNVKEDEVLPQGKNIYFFQDVKVGHPLLASVEVEKDFFSRAVNIKVEERTPFAIWCWVSGGGDDCFWFDKEGIIFAPAPAGEGVLWKSVYDSAPRQGKIGDNVLDDDLRENLFKIFSVIDSAGIPVLKFEVDSSFKQEIGALSLAGPKLLFSLRLDPGFTAEPLESLKDKFLSLEYVDFRSENKVFYK